MRSTITHAAALALLALVACTAPAKDRATDGANRADDALVEIQAQAEAQHAELDLVDQGLDLPDPNAAALAGARKRNGAIQDAATEGRAGVREVHAGLDDMPDELGFFAKVRKRLRLVGYALIGLVCLAAVLALGYVSLPYLPVIRALMGRLGLAIDRGTASSARMLQRAERSSLGTPAERDVREALAAWRAHPRHDAAWRREKRRRADR